MENEERLVELLGAFAEYDISMVDYHKRAATLGSNLSSHALSTFRDSPSCFEYHKTVAFKKKTKDMIIGSVFHKLRTEPDDFMTEYMVDSNAPVNEKTGKCYGRESIKFKDWSSQIKQTGREIITEDEFQDGLMMSKAVGARPDLMCMLSGGFAELTITAEIHGVTCQIRPDYIKLEQDVSGRISIVMPDLKKCADIQWFYYDAYKKWEYQYQLAFYRMILMKATGLEANQIYQPLIACEQKPYYRCGEFFFDERKDMIPATNMNSKLIKEYKKCLETNTWPTGYEQRTLIRA